MPEKWSVQSARQRKIGDVDAWEVMLLRADGKPHAHLMPTIALDWRAAEYGIDPTDVDTLLEVLLHEPFMEQAEDEAGQQTGWADGSIDLLSAENTDVARRAHLDRVKDSRVRIDVRGVSTLAPVHAGHRPDSDRIRAMREAVDTTRWLKKYGDFPAQPLPQNPVVKKETDRA
ncbi:hypothetical protein [Streptomyces antibioticus]|uniref:hypothetical protein n=1 Tax=Streptomyces antibioticus TaxID=1890 RepID=UPI0036F5F20B